MSNESFADMRGYNTVNNIDEIISGPIGDDSAGIAGRDYFKDKRQLNKHYITYNLNSYGFFERPITFTGKRKQPGLLQSALKDVMAAEADLVASLGSNSSLKEDLDKAVIALKSKIKRHKIERTEKEVRHYLDFTRETINRVTEFMEWMGETKKEWAGTALEAMLEGFPRVNGTSNDLTSSIRAGFISMAMVEKSVDKGIEGAWKAMQNTYDQALSERSRWMDFYGSEVDEWKSDLEEEISNLDGLFGVLGDSISDINNKLAVLDEAKGKYRILLAQGDRLLTEREWFRERAAAIVQGYRTKDASFRIFRNEKLERYKALFDLSSRYTYLAVKAFDYETGLLNTDAGRRFTSRVINSRAIGVMKDGEPQFGGGNAGDPGLSSILAEMKADYEVLRGRLGFNNPDTQGTTISLRLEKYRILPGAAGEDNWRELLYRNRRSNLLDDPDIRNNAIQIDQGDGLPVPGLVFEFSTSIANGYNVFGLPLAGGDSQFSPSNFATKIHGVGIGFENYKGMESISTNNGVVSGAGGDSPSTPTAPWLEPLNLSKTPYVYLIPLGQDKMRSPPLGDASVIRSWSVNDTTIPMPFNIGASDFSSRSIWQAQDTLSGEFLNTRKHQSFRAVLWNVDDGVGTFDNLSPQSGPSNILNNRLIGRSVWNTKWKLVIPGRTLLHNADEGIERFINSVSDIKLHFESYSYSGN